MKHFVDSELRAQVFVYDSVEGPLKSAEAPRGPDYFRAAFEDAHWTGAAFRTWEDVRTKMCKPWPEGRKRVDAIRQAIADAHIPKPESRARRHRFSEDDGEVVTERVLAGEPEYFRETYRTVQPGTQNITLLMHFGGNSYRSSDSMFWSTASTIALLDMLEEAGFSCEVWGYKLSRGYYRGTHNNTHCALVRIKGSGEPVNIESMMVAGSGWYYRTAMMGSGFDAPGLRVESGMGMNAHSIGQFARHIDTHHSLVVELPDSVNQADAIQNCRELLAAIIAQRDADQE